MIERRAPSPAYNAQEKLRRTASAKLGSARFLPSRDHPPVAPKVPEDATKRSFQLNKQGKRQSDLINLMRKTRIYPIAPDALIPNSSCRQIFEKPQEETSEVKLFKLRLDILNNLPKKEIPESDDETDLYEDEYLEWQKSKQTGPGSQRFAGSMRIAAGQKGTGTDLLERLLNEPWWKKPKEETPDLPSKLLHLCDILRFKQAESYPSACTYTIEISRAFGIDSSLMNQILSILLQHLRKEGHDALDTHTVRTVSQLMIETKEIVVCLFEYGLKTQSMPPIRQEVINAIKYLTEVNNTDDINLIFDNLSAILDAPEENFSLKMIIHGLKVKIRGQGKSDQEDGEGTVEAHPLLQKICEERWFPRHITIITVDTVLDAIIDKLPTAGKTLLKTLMNHLIQIDRDIGYNKEQFDRVAHALVILLQHTDADTRLIAATYLGHLGRETKVVDLGLLNSFANDPRVLVRTECGDSLKKLTNVTSDTVLADCAAEIPYLQTLPEENFSLANYLAEKKRVRTPPTIKEPSFVDEEETDEIVNGNNDQSDSMPEKTPTITGLMPPNLSSVSISHPLPPPSSSLSHQQSITPSLISTATPIEPVTRVSFHEKDESTTTGLSHTKPTRVRISNPVTRSRKQVLPPINANEGKQSGSGLLPNNTAMWDSYEKQNAMKDSMNEDTSARVDPIQSLIDEHKQQMAFYRAMLNRRVLVPHKVSMSQIFGDQAHVLLEESIPSQAVPSMKISDLENNQRQLNEVEHNQLLSSLVIRTIQVHRQYEKFSPGLSTNFAPALTISPMPLHASSKTSPSLVLPPIPTHSPTASEMARLRARAGVNLRKAQALESLLEQLLEPTQGSSIVSMGSTSNSYSSRTVEVTHAWLLVQLLKSRGITDSENVVQKLIERFPRYLPLLQTRVPHDLVPTIWNDPLVKQIASFFGQAQEEILTAENLTPKQTDPKPSKHTRHDDSVFDPLDFAIHTMTEDSKKRFLPPVRTSRGSHFRHVVKFGFRELDSEALESPVEENSSRARRRRVYMHFMMPTTETLPDRHEAIRQPYRPTAFIPIVTRPPVCH